MLNCSGVELTGGEYFSRFSYSGGVVIKLPIGKITATLREEEELVIQPEI